MDIKLLPGERIDELQRNGLRIIQNKKVFSFTMDSVLLSAFVSLTKGDKVVDLGTGTGVLPLLIVGRKQVKEVIGIEIQDLLADMSKRSVELNNINNIQIIKTDLKRIHEKLGHEQYDVVVSNPPYMIPKTGEISTLDAKAVARHEISCNLEDVIFEASKLVKYGGKFAMVHRPERIVDICYLMRHYKLEPKRIRLVQSRPDSTPRILLIEGIKGGKPGLITLPTLIIYEQDGSYTEEVKKIYYT
ncbi:tRNA1(Val) (adenine(37)-N6)-methyltransferase [Alkalicella caledoniensis]|uniref:tRNA1(Val) (Adenine(37)-N6)-methyltransferase n=1 Tax=Alkalicella caledoniensis TaxID=2731377 RepID=A0A7G9W889_ALKCA|nr:tRNA1(Val) (adenine(37)-N6)-methyltransferase [Alkalicella caledoniensis]QNO14901.1 tRNA1(Val) (adenine(37)-N6)-methyltransferase [Alkalicella caledoniensis]